MKARMAISIAPTQMVDDLTVASWSRYKSLLNRFQRDHEHCSYVLDTT